MLKILLISLVLISTVQANCGIHQIQKNTKRLVSLSKARQLFEAADKAAKKFSIPTNLILAIANVESSYRLNAINPKSNDYGIMQVNEYHIQKGVDKHRLLTDLDYSFYQGVRVFHWFYKNYNLDEAIMRYNCGTRKSCINLEKVKNYLDKVKRSL